MNETPTLPRGGDGPAVAFPYSGLWRLPCLVPGRARAGHWAPLTLGAGRVHLAPVRITCWSEGGAPTPAAQSSCLPPDPCCSSPWHQGRLSSSRPCRPCREAPGRHLSCVSLGASPAAALVLTSVLPRGGCTHGLCRTPAATRTSPRTSGFHTGLVFTPVLQTRKRAQGRSVRGPGSCGLQRVG